MNLTYWTQTTKLYFSSYCQIFNTSHAHLLHYSTMWRLPPVSSSFIHLFPPFFSTGRQNNRIFPRLIHFFLCIDEKLQFKFVFHSFGVSCCRTLMFNTSASFRQKSCRVDAERCVTARNQYQRSTITMFHQPHTQSFHQRLLIILMTPGDGGQSLDNHLINGEFKGRSSNHKLWYDSINTINL